MKGHWIVSVLASILILGSLGLSQQAFAIMSAVDHFNDLNCDFLFIDPVVDELGTVGFPPDETITSSDNPSISPTACPGSISPPTGSVLVNITNTVIPPKAFTDVWYVGDVETTFSNFDGFADIGGGPLPAFRIDPTGANTPLQSESIAYNGIWEPGENWGFIIDSYSTPSGLPPSAIDSPGIDSITPPSSGSIIVFDAFGESPPIPIVGGTIIPLDTTALLVAGAQTISPWLILGVLSAVGIGFVIFTLKRR